MREVGAPWLQIILTDWKVEAAFSGSKPLSTCSTISAARPDLMKAPASNLFMAGTGVRLRR